MRLSHYSLVPTCVICSVLYAGRFVCSSIIILHSSGALSGGRGPPLTQEVLSGVPGGDQCLPHPRIDLLFHLAVSLVRDVDMFVGSSVAHSFIMYLSKAFGVTGLVLGSCSAE